MDIMRAWRLERIVSSYKSIKQESPAWAVEPGSKA